MTTDTLLVFQDGRWQDVVPGSASMSETNLTLAANILAREIGGKALNNGTGWTGDDEYDVSEAAILILPALQAAHAAGVAAERARVTAVLDAENAELLEWAKESEAAGDEEGLSSFKADLGGLYLLRRKLLKDIVP